jgi:hypothetical protein
MNSTEPDITQSQTYQVGLGIAAAALALEIIQWAAFAVAAGFALVSVQYLVFKHAEPPFTSIVYAEAMIMLLPVAVGAHFARRLLITRRGTPVLVGENISVVPAAVAGESQ